MISYSEFILVDLFANLLTVNKYFVIEQGHLHDLLVMRKLSLHVAKKIKRKNRMRGESEFLKKF